MISERQFASLFASAWKLCAPRSREVLADLNRRATRFSAPVEIAVPAERRSLVAEMGFRLFQSMATTRTTELSEENVARIHADTERYIFRLLPANRQPFFTAEPSHASECSCATAEAEVLYNLFRHDIEQGLIQFAPEFRGCGLVDECYGDVLNTRGVLYEVKSRVGKFEQIDLRQVIIYAVLGHLDRPGKIKHVSLVNPNRGLYVCEEWDALVTELSGLATQEFINNVIEFVTPVPPE